DGVHTSRIARIYPDQVPNISETAIGEMLSTEARGLPEFDHVFCLASFEAEICRWLGAQSVSWLPRRLDGSQLLEWNPISDRIGCVGTFDHPPNFEGIELFCAALAKLGPGSLRLRLISRSKRAIASLQSRYTFVEDLGVLEREGVGDELAT